MDNPRGINPLATATTAWPALGTVLSLSTDGGTTYLPVGEVVSVGNAGGGEVGERDTTNLGSTAHTSAATIPDNGEVTFTLNFDPTDANHKQIYTWKETPPATTPAWKVDFASSPVQAVKFNAWVKSIDGANAEGVDDNLAADVTLRVTGNTTLAAGP